MVTAALVARKDLASLKSKFVGLIIWAFQKSIVRALKINGKLVKPDVYDPITNTIYEFSGDFWHGNLSKFKTTDTNMLSKKTFGELNRLTIEREQMIIDAGFNVVSTWESDWKMIEKGITKS